MRQLSAISVSVTAIAFFAHVIRDAGVDAIRTFGDECLEAPASTHQASEKDSIHSGAPLDNDCNPTESGYSKGKTDLGDYTLGELKNSLCHIRLLMAIQRDILRLQALEIVNDPEHPPPRGINAKRFSELYDGKYEKWAKTAIWGKNAILALANIPGVAGANTAATGIYGLGLDGWFSNVGAPAWEALRGAAAAASGEESEIIAKQRQEIDGMALQSYSVTSYWNDVALGLLWDSYERMRIQELLLSTDVFSVVLTDAGNNANLCVCVAGMAFFQCKKWNSIRVEAGDLLILGRKTPRFLFKDDQVLPNYEDYNTATCNEDGSNGDRKEHFRVLRVASRSTGSVTDYSDQGVWIRSDMLTNLMWYAPKTDAKAETIISEKIDRTGARLGKMNATEKVHVIDLKPPNALVVSSPEAELYSVHIQHLGMPEMELSENIFGSEPGELVAWELLSATRAKWNSGLALTAKTVVAGSLVVGGFWFPPCWFAASVIGAGSAGADAYMDTAATTSAAGNVAVLVNALYEFEKALFMDPNPEKTIPFTTNEENPEGIKAVSCTLSEECLFDQVCVRQGAFFQTRGKDGPRPGVRDGYCLPYHAIRLPGSLRPNGLTCQIHADCASGRCKYNFNRNNRPFVRLYESYCSP